MILTDKELVHVCPVSGHKLDHNIWRVILDWPGSEVFAWKATHAASSSSILVHLKWTVLLFSVNEVG
jgi:hypothetical protein